MSPGTHRPPPEKLLKNNTLEISFAPVNNLRLANLCGALDENLRQIENTCEVTISRRGEHFTLTGAPEKARVAARVLESFYGKAGHALRPEDLQLGLVQAAHTPGTHSATGEPVLITRRADLQGRGALINKLHLEDKYHEEKHLQFSPVDHPIGNARGLRRKTV